jgi:hypothetical protein
VPVVGGASGANDAFYHALSSYHTFNMCNCWVGRGLASAGVRTGWFTRLPRTVALDMPTARADGIGSDGHRSYSSSGRPSGSAKKVNRFPVCSSTRTGSVATPHAARCATAASRSATANARCRSPHASG